MLSNNFIQPKFQPLSCGLRNWSPPDLRRDRSLRISSGLVIDNFFLHLTCLVFMDENVLSSKSCWTIHIEHLYGHTYLQRWSVPGIGVFKFSNVRWLYVIFLAKISILEVSGTSRATYMLRWWAMNWSTISDPIYIYISFIGTLPLLDFFFIRSCLSG